MAKLSGKVALVTGGNSGMGRVSAKRLAEEGAQVVITGRRQKELDDAVQWIGHKALGVQGDVANLDDLDRLIATIRQKYGHLDIIFANAGFGRFTPVDKVTEEEFDSQFATNVKGLFFTVQKGLPLMRDNGSIILNASVAASKGIAGGSVYSATKAAVRSLARTWTNDLKSRKIRVNSLSPGPIEAPILHKMGVPAEHVQAIKDGFVAQVPLGRMGTSEEIANTVLFLASDESSFITGIDLSVDGGLAQV